MLRTGARNLVHGRPGPVPSRVHALSTSTRRASRTVSNQRASIVLPRFAASAGLSRSTVLGLAALVTVFTTLQLTASPLALDAQPRLVQDGERKVSPKEVQEHVTEDSAWVVLDGVVFDVTEFMTKHPGGKEAILEHLGKDISPLFNLLHASDVLRKTFSQLTVVGLLDQSSEHALEVVASGVDEVEERRDELPPPEYVINLAEYVELARQVHTEDSRAWRFMSSFADDGVTYEATKNSFSFLRFLPRVNVPVSTVSTDTSYLASGKTVPVPLMMSPTGGSANAHPDGELNVTRCAAATGIPQIVSTMASYSFEDIAAERDRLAAEGVGRAPLWWQLYIMSDRKESERRLRVAKDCGAEAIVITLDVATIGKREADAKVLVTKGGAKGAKPGGGIAATGSKVFDADLTWADIAWVRKHAPGIPVIVKGLATVEDVRLAKANGADGVILSNHGGRQLEYSPPPLATLVRLHQFAPKLLQDSKFDVYIDGGVHRGTDVLKALCLGAKGVGLGRAMLYAQAAHGEAGCIRVTEILKEEIVTGMKLLGAKTIKDLKPEMLELMDGLVGKQL